MTPTVLRPPANCDFCGKAQREVKSLIVGESAFICDECVELCVDILLHDAPAASWRRVALAAAREALEAT